MINLDDFDECEECHVLYRKTKGVMGKCKRCGSEQIARTSGTSI